MAQFSVRQHRTVSAWRPGWRLIALLLYVLLTLIMTWPLARQVTRAIPGDSFDGWQNYWNLWWMRQAWLVEHQSPYFTTLLHYPTGVDLRFQTMAPFNGLTFLNVQLAGNIFLAYNSAVLFSFVIGGYGAYLLALYALRQVHASLSSPRRAFITHAAAFVAGIVFAFSPYHFAHLLGHLQLIALQWIPFYVLYLVRGLDRAANRRLAAADIFKLAMFLILVGLCDWYYVMYCLLFTGLVLVVRLVQHQLGRQGIVLIVGAGGLAGLALLPLLGPMLQGARAWGGTSLLRDYSETINLSADLLAFFTPQVFHPLWGDWAAARSAAFTATRSEFTVFVGYGVLFLAGVVLIYAMRTSARRDAVIWLLGAFMFGLLALGPVLHVAGRTDLLPGGRAIPLPYALLYDYVPFIKLSRSVSRMTVMVMLCLGVTSAFGLVYPTTWLAQRRRRLALVAPLAAAGLILFEFLAIPYPMSPPDTPAWYFALANEPTTRAVLNLPANWPRPGYLLYQTVHGKPLSTGYVTRDDPQTLLERAPVLSHFRWLGPDIHTQSFDLQAHGMQVLYDLLGVGWVVLDRYKMPTGLGRTYTESAAQAIFAAADQAPIFADERLTVYAVQEPAQRRPYLVLGTDWTPRQTDEQGRVWRTLSKKGSALEIVNPESGDLTLVLTVQGMPNSKVRAIAADGTHLGEWTLSGGMDVLRTQPFFRSAGRSQLRLATANNDSAAELVIYAVDVLPAP